MDFETYSEAPLTGMSSVGVWEYSVHPSTQALMVAYDMHDGLGVNHVDLTQEPFPDDLRDALLDPMVEKWGFNAAFERLITRNVLEIDTPYRGWRCTMALANMQSFTGDLLQVGVAMGLPQFQLKDKEGSRLIRTFCQPQRLTRKNTYERRDRKTDPTDWQLFCDYNTQDVAAEDAIRDRLIRFEVPEAEWEIYAIDQEINDNGLPVNRRFVQNADVLADIRRAELKRQLKTLTGLWNPNSTQKLLPWLIERGYPYEDLQKASVTKAIKTDREEPCLTKEAREALRIRQNVSRTSVRKYPAILRRLSEDDRLRHSFQYGGAARTLRWAGRGPQPHNLTHTPKQLKPDDERPDDWEKLESAARTIENGDYSDMSLLFNEPMIALAGSVRSSFQAPAGYELRMCDLKAIENAVLAWLSGCERMLNVFHEKLDPYKSFGAALYNKPYAEITGAERQICKSAVLGCGFQLGGGEFKKGKRTGLWGYAENMGVDIPREEAHRHVKVFRSTYHEIPTFWYNLDDAARAAIAGRPTTVNGKIHFEMDGPYLTVRLPSGRKLFYYKPKIVLKEFEGKDKITGEPVIFTRWVVSFMGKNQLTHQWGRAYTSGGKWTENVVQATARDILAHGMRRCHEYGFTLVGSVHDELIAIAREGDNRFTVEAMRSCMIEGIKWTNGLPLDASGYAARIYRKD